MASELSDYLANKVLGWVDGAAMGTAPAACYLGLFNGNPTGSGAGGTEVTATVRVAGRVAISWGAITGRNMDNDAAVDFGTSAGNATVDHIGIFDAASGGNMLGYSPATNSRAVVTGDPVVVPIGDLSFNFN